MKRCPECRGKVKKLISSGSGIIFKGSGFYTTDYKRSSAVSGSSTASGGNGSSKPKDSKTGTKSDSSGNKGSSGGSNGD